MPLRLLLIAATALVPTVAVAQTITFDALQDGGPLIPNGYAGFNWSNVRTIDAINVVPSGFKNARVSSRIVAYNGAGMPASFSSTGTFTFNSAWFTAAWNDALFVSVSGSAGGVQNYFASFVVSTASPTLQAFDWVNVDKVTITTSGGVHHSGYSGNGTQVAFDDVTVNAAIATPEPASFLLLATGLAGVLGVCSRRKR